MKMKFELNDIGFTPMILILSFVCVGVFHEYISCVFSVAMLIWLFLKYKKEKKLFFRINAVSIAIGVLVISYLLSVIWAVDSGLAFIGFFKFLPVLLFLICLFQEKESSVKIMQWLPYTAVVMALISIVGMHLPGLKLYFNVSSRLAGFFQYPNTFALFLLVAELVLLVREKHKWYDYLCMLMLLVSILLTGSRTAFLLAVVANGLAVLVHRNRKLRFAGIAVVVFGVIAVASYVFFFDKNGILSRLSSISLAESTFVGRMLYYMDAIPLILKKPLGIGYQSYYYMQQSIQTGVYNIRFIHNDFLQIMLDVGWIPCLLFVIAIFKSVFSKNVTREKKLILMTMCAHSCLDFNLQFVAMFMLIILFMDFDSGNEYILQKHMSEIKATCWVVGVAACWIGLSLVFNHMKAYEASDLLYPWNTHNKVELIGTIENLTEMNEVADKILNQNEYATIGYSAKARCAFAQGDFTSVIQYKNQIFEKAPFQYSDCEEYCYMMMNGVTLFLENGDEKSAKVCANEFLRTYERVKNIRNELSEYGKKISLQPRTLFPDEIEFYARDLKGEK